ncbi:hypothetical protein DYB32_004764 [Aphanomyces invadans]|uniref:DDE-1 domain-containing protein n=1 Tax=Aphanomyces invadans TaxID=157072 RepID=A0A3R6ZQL3_9STRA|nr:hypothetical protein DYB32_004764 [Aphanomyces invadans]
MLFMTLASLKHCGSWDIAAAVFKEAPPTFSKRVTGFIECLYPFLKAKYIDNMASKWTMTQLRSCGHSFKNFPMALYAVDVTFQKTNAPVGSFAEKKRFFSKKHGQYGLKVEVSVLPNGYAINVTSAAPGSIADLTICEENEGFHLVMLAKRPDEESMHDNGRHQEQHPGSWALLADKGYQGLQRRLRAITPTKKPPGGMLSSSELVQNDKIASDRKSKKRITVALTTNAAGTKSIDPLFIGTAAKSRCCGGQTPAELGFDYYASKKGRVDSDIVNSYLEALNVKMAEQGRKVLMLLDNAPPHLVFETTPLSNVRVKKLPPNTTNTTAFLQLQDAES